MLVFTTSAFPTVRLLELARHLVEDELFPAPPAFGKSTDDDIKAGLEEMNRALKNWAERAAS